MFRCGADDAVKTDPDKYRVVFENERVRVLEYRDKPGEKTKTHTHPDFVLQAMGAVQAKINLIQWKDDDSRVQSGRDCLDQCSESHR